MVEQRRTKRFEIKLPLKVVRHGLRPFSGGGETRNLSSGGVLFDADSRVEAGEPIEYVITFPTLPESESLVSLHCLGKVLRAAREVKKPDPQRPFAVAATLERYEFRRLKP
ncbi:MAG: PilZ domain-containing protein [Acidobacteriota bacterium]